MLTCGGNKSQPWLLTTALQLGWPSAQLGLPNTCVFCESDEIARSGRSAECCVLTLPAGRKALELIDVFPVKTALTHRVVGVHGMDLLSAGGAQHLQHRTTGQRGAMWLMKPERTTKHMLPTM